MPSEGLAAAPFGISEGACVREPIQPLRSVQDRSRDVGGVDAHRGLIVLLADRCDLADRRQPLDRHRHGRAVGRQEPVLCLLPLPRLHHPLRLRAVLEPLPLRRPSERRRSAVADLRAAVRAVGAVRSGALDPRVRSHRLRASAGRRPGRRRAGLACGLADAGLDPGRRRSSCSAARRRAGCSTPASS